MNTFCKLCKNSIHEKELLVVKELMFGINQKFMYGECSFCGALSLQDNIIDFSKYYDKNIYYSMANINIGFFHMLKKIYWNILYGSGFFSNLFLNILMIFYTIFSKEICESIRIERERIRFYRKYRLFEDKNATILDIGCGEGHWLSKLECMGFKNLTGLDPYIEKSHKNSDTIELIKGDVHTFSCNNSFDLINLSHSLEHMYDHHAVIKNIAKLIKKKGIIMVSIPLKNQAYEIYKESWFQIDAPRHIIIHTVDSFKKLIEQNGLEIVDSLFDSGAKQFFISEFYKKNISMGDGTRMGLKKYNFAYYMKLAQLYNEKLLGDQAIFLLRKKAQK